MTRKKPPRFNYTEWKAKNPGLTRDEVRASFSRQSIDRRLRGTALAYADKIKDPDAREHAKQWLRTPGRTQHQILSFIERMKLQGQPAQGQTEAA